VPPIVRESSVFELSYDRKKLSYKKPPPYLEDYVGRPLYLSTKQVPSCLAIAKPGSLSVRRNKQILLENNFYLEERTGAEVKLLTPGKTEFDRVSASSAISSWLSGDGQENKQPPLPGMGDLEEEQSSEPSSDEEDEDSEEPSSDSEEEEDEKSYLKIAYLDYFKVIQAAIYSQQVGRKMKIRVWGGDGLRLQDALPHYVLGDTYTGKRKVCFHKLALPETKRHVLYQRTYWGLYLCKLIARGKDQEPSSDAARTSNWAKNLQRRINALLEGKPDPQWSKDTVEKYWADEGRRPTKARAVRFLELLKTVDGMFLQRFLVAPEENWSYEKHDKFVLSCINFLIGDEFLDGQITKEATTLNSSYELLKKVRSKAKLTLLHNWSKERFFQEVGHLPSALGYFFPLISHIEKFWDDPVRYSYMCGVLSQKRGSGKPPSVVVLKSKIKFLKTVSEKPEPLTPTESGIVSACMDTFLNKQDPSIFTGLTTKARISVTLSACWEQTQKEGGTLSAIQKIVAAGGIGLRVPIRDLETGKVTSMVQLTDVTVGEYIFWACLDEVLHTPKSDLRVASVVMVKEPGKARTVTKGPACLKIVLDLVNKICSWPLLKVSSSESGMGKASHGWNFFKTFFMEENKDMNFIPVRTEEMKYNGSVARVVTYQERFVSSTDFETATDNFHHEVAWLLAEPWIRKCGLPKVLRILVRDTCFVPREIYFNADGALKEIGVDRGEQLRSIPLVRGLLMGDPMTKVVLHLLNICVRELPMLSKSSSLTRFCSNSEEIRGLLKAEYPYID